jgi:hypothetical protein
MSGINRKYDIKLEVLTPLSVGAGAENDLMEGTDYVVKEGVLYKLNLRKMLDAGINIESLSSYFAAKDSKSILNIVGSRLESVSDYTMSMPAKSSNDIKSFVKNQLSGHPVVPGSSLKGAIRSILFDYLRDDEKNESLVFGSSDKGDEFMRFIKLSDVEFKDTELVNTKIFNLRKAGNEWTGGWKHAYSGQGATTGKFNPIGFNTLYEVLMPGQKSRGYLMLSEGAFDLFDHKSFYKEEMQVAKKIKEENKRKEKVAIINNLQSKVESKSEVIKDISVLFKIINNHTKKYLEKEKFFFNKYSAENSEKIVESINGLISQIPSDNSFCIFKMSAGSGFHSITGDWQFSDYTNTEIWKDGRNAGKMKYKSRKIAVEKNAFSLMGFVKMSVLTPEQMAKHEKQREEQRKKGDEELRLAEQKLEEAKKKEQEKQKLLSKYNSTIEKANKFYNDGYIEKALEAYNKAADVFPEGKKHTKRIVEIEGVLKAQREQQEFEEQQRLQKLREQQRREERLDEGLRFLEEKNLHGNYKVTDFTGVKNRIERWLKQSKNSATPEEQDDILATTLKRIYNSINKERDREL